jgi:hypothetical protein
MISAPAPTGPARRQPPARNGSLHTPDAAKLLPPLVIDDADLLDGLARLSDAVTAVTTRPAATSTPGRRDPAPV